MNAPKTGLLRRAAGLAALGLATTLATAGCGTDAAPATARARVASAAAGRPNVLLITADDASVQDLRHMPYTQRLLADRGVTFSNAIAPTPICVPARASLLTGQYAHNHHALTIDGTGGGYRAFAAHGGDRGTLPVWLRSAGYDTLFVGKYLNGYGDDYRPVVEPGWTDWRAALGGSTYSFVHTVMNENGHKRKTTEYSTDLFSDLAVGMLGEKRRRVRPWYMWVNYVGPHHGGPHESDDPKGLKTTMPAPRHRNEFKHLDLPRSPALWAGDGPGQRTALPPAGRNLRAAMREGHQQRVEALQSVDEGVKRLVAKLKSTGQYANTIVMFTSDNGYVTGEHNRYGKLWEFNDILRIPAVIAGPGIPHGKTVATAITNPDIAATIAALAHANPTRTVDGVNFLPILSQPYRERAIPLEAYPVHGGTRPLYTGVRVGPWTYIKTGGGHEELYNRHVDPYELSSLAARPQYQDALAWLRDLSVTYRDCAGPSCPRDYLTPAQMRAQWDKTAGTGAAADALVVATQQ